MMMSWKPSSVSTVPKSSWTTICMHCTWKMNTLKSELFSAKFVQTNLLPSTFYGSTEWKLTFQRTRQNVKPADKPSPPWRCSGHTNWNTCHETQGNLSAVNALRSFLKPRDSEFTCCDFTKGKKALSSVLTVRGATTLNENSLDTF